MEKCGIDVHQKSSQVKMVDDEETMLERASIPTPRPGLERWFGHRGPMRILLDDSGSSPSVVRLLREFGHEVGAVHPRRIRPVAGSTLKTDRVDADTLAVPARLKLRLWTLVWERGEETQRLRAHLRVRRALLEVRARFIVTVRGLVRWLGGRIASCWSDRFAARCEATVLPAGIGEVVAPLLGAIREQISAGAPVTVTHPEVWRYFMTIDEAAGPVLQAAYGDYGELCILDMGEQNRIAKLARPMITMAGLVPDVDVPIVFTGLRPGEKLHEELLTEEEERASRVSDKIFSAECPAPPADLEERLSALALAASTENDGNVLRIPRELVPSYETPVPTGA